MLFRTSGLGCAALFRTTGPLVGFHFCESGGCCDRAVAWKVDGVAKGYLRVCLMGIWQDLLRRKGDLHVLIKAPEHVPRFHY